MLESEKRMIGTVAVLVLKGRFDSHGAAIFEQEVASLDLETGSLVLDISRVNYLSSMGVRALLKTQKALKQRGSGAILVGVPPFLQKVMELSGIFSHFIRTSGLEEALERASQMVPSKSVREESIIDGWKYLITDFGNVVATLDTWGDPLPDAGQEIVAENLASVGNPDLGIGFGIGGFGPDRENASQALGELVAVGGLAAVAIEDPHGESDYLLGEDPSGSEIFTVSAASFTGNPSHHLECTESKPISLSELMDHIMKASGRDQEAEGSLVGIVVYAGVQNVAAAHYERSDAISTEVPREMKIGARSTLLVGIGASGDLDRSPQGLALPWFLKRGCSSTAKGNTFHCHALLIDRFEENESPALENIFQGFRNLDHLAGAAHLEPETKFLRPKVWLYRLSEVRPGTEKLLKIEGAQTLSEPWEQLTRRLFPDAARLALEPLQGGYMGKTFRAIPYAQDGRRMLPSVLKLGPKPVIEREVKAFQEHVEKYVLNNSTSIMGRASSGEWGGIRYTFVGISGPESRLTWLAEHYQKRPTHEVLPLLERLFAGILKPWYGQPRWEEIRPYREHNPLHLFPSLLEDGERITGISADAETLPCPELNLNLPNPFRFLKHEYPARRDKAFLWYRCVTHGDLNMRNILLDEVENLYVIDFSETKVRNAVSDFGRLEAIAKIEMTRLEGEPDLKLLLGFEAGLASASRLGEAAPCIYEGDDPAVEKAYRVISLLRGYADRVTLFEENIIPYYLALLEWTYPVVSYRSANLWQKRFAAYSAGLIVRRILDLE